MMEADPRRLLAQLAVSVIVADGRVTTSELEAARRLDDLGLGRLSTLVEDELRNAAHRRIDVAAACGLLRERVPDAGPVILAALAGLAAADRALSEGELGVLEKAASGFGLTPAEVQEVLGAILSGGDSGPPADAAPQVSPPPPRAPEPRATADATRAFALLGLDAAATRADLDDHYRRLIERYDPVKVIDLGSDFAALAIRKLAELTDAYELVAGALASQV